MRQPRLAATVVAAALAAVLVAAIPVLAAGGSGGGSSRPSVLASGAIVSGVIGGGCVASAKGDVCSAVASIYPLAPGPIDDASFGIIGGLVENPECVGTVRRPLATPGVLCIYPNEDEALNIGRNGEGSISVQAYPIYNGRRGFKVVWNAAKAGSSQFYAVWVYQAP